MKTKIPVYCLTTFSLLVVCFSSQAQTRSQSEESDGASARAISSGGTAGDVFRAISVEPSAWMKMQDLTERHVEFFQPKANEDSVVNTSQSMGGAARTPYPGGGSGGASSSPTHFEIEGFVQWRNITRQGNISTSDNVSLTNTLGIGNYKAGPLVRFIWTPEGKILGASSKIWVEYGKIDRSRTRQISGTFTFDGRVYLGDATLKAELKTKQFEFGYAPRWGNEKFKIGPSFAYERLNVDFILSDLSPGAPPPTTKNVNVPNNIFLMGGDFEYTPIQKFKAYGHFGAVPCCGGGWHAFESEVGSKYFLNDTLGIMAGIRYSYFRRDFEATANGTTANGSLKFPGWGPFLGASFRF